MLQGKTALVTGSSQGIGLGVATAFIKAGARVVCTSEQPREKVPALENSHYIQADLLKDGEAERLVAEASERLGGIDIVVNNVGTWREPNFLDLTREQFDLILRLNVW